MYFSSTCLVRCSVGDGPRWRVEAELTSFLAGRLGQVPIVPSSSQSSQQSNSHPLPASPPPPLPPAPKVKLKTKAKKRQRERQSDLLPSPLPHLLDLLRASLSIHPCSSNLSFCSLYSLPQTPATPCPLVSDTTLPIVPTSPTSVLEQAVHGSAPLSSLPETSSESPISRRKGCQGFGGR